jgi:hypothetical protein
MIQKEPGKMEKLIEQKQEAFSYIFSNFIIDKDLSELSDLSKTKNFVKELLSHVPDQILHNHYTEKIKQIGKIDLGISISSISNSDFSQKNTKGLPVKDNICLLEKTYLQLLIFSKDRSEEIFIPSRYFSSSILGEMYLTIKHSDKTELADIVKLFENDENKRIFMEDIIFRSTEIDEDSKKQLEKLTRRLKKQYLTRQQKALSVKIAIAEESNNSGETEKLLAKMQHLTKLLKKVTDD